MRLRSILLILACVGAFVPLATVATPAYADTCTVALGGSCGGYIYQPITWSLNGYTTYVNDQNVGCDGPSVCNDQLTATDPGHWSLTTSMNAPGAYCSQVRTYPDVQQLTQNPDGSSIALSAYKSLYSSFDISSPPAGSYEAAYDVWLGSNWQEVMVWVDTQNHATGGTLHGAPSFAGQPFQVFAYGSKASPGEIIVKLDSNEMSGTVHIKAILAWLTKHGWLTPSEQTVNQINFGWEVCGTDGISQTFTMNNYSLTGVPSAVTSNK